MLYFIGGLKISRRICGLRLASTKKIHAPSHPQNHKNKTKEEEAFWKAFEEDASHLLSGFQTAARNSVEAEKEYGYGHRGH